jgi:ubiquitin carboxyl-terminal hydrolase 4/11/15
MAVNDTGASGGGDAEQRSAPNITSPSKTLGGRSASPAKRRAEDMEGGSVAPQKSPSSPTREGGLGRKEEEDVSMGDTAPLDDAQDTVASSISTSVEGSDTTSSSSATSLGLEQPPPYAHTVEASSSTNEKVFSTEEIDEKVAKVRELAAAPLRHGDRGVCIAKAWLDRVLSRTSEGLNDKQYANDAREGCIGPLDNSSIVPDGAFDEPVLRDKNSLPFIRLKVGVAVEEDFVILPYETFGSIVGDYGYAAGQKHPIIRYAIDTAEVGASSSNVQYELHPPIITVRKVPQPGSDAQQTKPKTSLGALRVKRQGHEQFGQRSPEDAVRLVTSRSEKFQDFLRRAKDAAAIHMTTKVRVWHLLDPADVIVDTPKTVQSAVPSPPASREASPAKIGNNKLVVPQESFKKMEIGKELEDKDVDDQTNNPKYNGNRTMAVAGFFRDMTMLLEEQLGGPAGGEFQSDSKARVTKLLNTKSTSGASSGRTSPVPSGMMTRGRTRKDGKTRGTVGLSNLGNTCYMNSALQCIRSVEELAVYFLSKRFKKEINNDNPLGYKGAMANAYAGVLRGIYESNGGSSFSPIDFKKSLGKYQPLFSGYGQQDSQEFLSFLVDALHEDLNRIVKKPYIENPDSDDDRVMDPQYILELGETYRTNHAKRNDSVAMDLFSGFYKNKMECPDCNKVSVTFDPYSLVTVQLPIENTMQHDFTYVPLRGKPILHHLDMDKNASIKQVKEVLAKKHPGVDANRLWMIEVYNRKVYRVIDDQSAVAEANIQANDHMFVFELEHVPRNGKKRAYTFNNSVNAMPLEGMASEIAEAFTVPILHRSTEGNSGSGLVMYPIYITVTKEEAKNYDVILKKILVAVANMTSRPILKEFDERSDLSSHVQNGEAPQQPNSTDDAAGISDNSAQSEDGYVNISIEKQDAEMANGTDQAESADSEQLSTYVPPDFMDDQYFLSPALRHHLFDLKYTPSESDSMQFTSGFNSTLKDGNLRIMADRVRKPSRRSSVQSSSSEDSTTSTGSGNRAIPDADEESDSNTKFDDEPDIVLGDVGTDALSSSVVEESEQETIGEDSQIMEPSDPGSTTRAGRRSKKNKRNKGKSGKGRNKHGFMTTSKKGVVQYGVKRPQLGGKRLPGQDDSPYYIQLGEAIVLDWKPEAFDSLFGGNPSDAEEMRGHSIVDENGKGGLIFQDPEQDAKKAKREARKKRGVDLDDCFEVTSRPEVLSEDNAWYCNRCKELRRATKTLEIWTLPDILVVHLKRFGGNRSFRDKVDLKVDYPIEGLDMSDKVGLKEDGKGYIYDLFAVDNHYGGLGGGHYTAIAKNFHDGQWYDYNGKSRALPPSPNAF